MVFVFLQYLLRFLLFHFLFCLFEFFLSSSWWVWPEVCQFCLTFQRTSSWFLWFFSIFFWISILLISSLIFMISFLLVTLGFVCSFSNLLKWCVKLSIWDFSSFLRKACISMNFSLSTASHRFWMVVSYHLSQGISKFPFDFLIDPLVF